MKRTFQWLISAVLVACVLGAMAAPAEAKGKKDKKKKDKDKDKKAKREEIPAKVKAAIKAKAGDAKIEKIKKEKEDGKTVWEAKWKADGRKTEVTFAANGQVLEWEVEVSLKEIPAGARKRILKEAGRGRVKEVEKVVVGRKVCY